MKKVWYKSNKEAAGFSLIEVILTVAIFLLIATGVYGSFYYGLTSSQYAGQRMRASALSEEGLEAVRSIRDQSFESLAPGSYGLFNDGTEWLLVPTSDAVGPFTRTITIADEDAHTKLVTSSVEWDYLLGRTGTLSLETRLTDWRVAAVVPPAQQGCVNLQGGQDAIKVDTSGNFAYVVTTSAARSLQSVNITNPDLPVELDSYGLQDNPRNIMVSGSYAYVATDHNSSELQIFNVTDPSNLQAPASVIDAPGNSDGVGIYVDGQEAFLSTTGTQGIHAINAANPATPSLQGSLALGTGAPEEVYKTGSYVYVVSSADAEEVQIVNIDNPATPVKQGIVDLSGNSDALTVVGFSGNLFVGREDGSLLVLDISDPINPQVVGTYQAGGPVHDIDVSNDGSYIFLATDNSTREFQIIDVIQPGSPVLETFLNTGSTLNGVSWNEAQSRAYVVGDSNFENFCSIAVTLPEPPAPVDTDQGMLTYVDYSGPDDFTRYKLLGKDGQWSPQYTVPDVPGDRKIRGIELFSSSTRDEKILVTKHADDYEVSNGKQYFWARVWNGTTWGNAIQLATYDNGINPHTHNFDGGYLANGNFIVVYDDFTYTPKYHVWNGTSWSGPFSVGSVGAYPVIIKYQTKPGTNEAMVVVRDHLYDSNAFYFNGSTWSAPFELSSNNSSFSAENLDFTWSRKTPTRSAAMLNDSTDSTPNIRVWAGSWGSSIENRSVGETSWVMRIVDRPNADEFLGCTKDTGLDIVCMKSGFTPSWVALTNGDVASNTDSGEQRSYDVAYQNDGSRALIVYSNGSSASQRKIPKWRSYDPVTSSFSSENSLPALGASDNDAVEMVVVVPNTQNNNIMALMGTTNLGVSTVAWDATAGAFYNTGGLGLTKHGSSGSNTLDYWFDFQWDYYEEE